MVKVQRNLKTIFAVSIDTPSSQWSSQQVDYCIADLLSHNNFSLKAAEGGPYRLRLSILDDHVSFRIEDSAGAFLSLNTVSDKTLRPLVMDYMKVCESHAAATAKGGDIEITVGAGRTSLHDSGAEQLQEQLKDFDFDRSTARKLFSVAVLLY